MLSSYSYSSLDTFRVCPRKFKYAYIDKVKTVPRVTADTYLGNAVHRVLKQLYSLGADGILMSLDEALNAYAQEWEKLDRNLITVVSDYYTVDDYIRIGREILAQHYESYKPFNQGTLLGAELHLTYELPGTTFKFRSYIDRLWKRDDGVVEICDYKTGQAMTLSTDPRFVQQMGLYQLAVQSNFPQFQEIELAQYFLRKNETVSRRLRPDELDLLEEQFRLAILETLQAEKTDDFPAQEGTHCNYCDFPQICPAKIHRRILDGEEQSGRTQELPAEELRLLTDQYLDKYRQLRELAAELDTLKEQLVTFAREYDVSRFEGDLGKVSVSLARKEEFVTKSQDGRAFAELSSLCRQLGLDEYFSLDPRALMKEVYQRKRLSDEQLKLLEAFIVEKERSRVTAKLDAEPQDGSEEL